MKQRRKIRTKSIKDAEGWRGYCCKTRAWKARKKTLNLKCLQISFSFSVNLAKNRQNPGTNGWASYNQRFPVLRFIDATQPDASLRCHAARRIDSEPYDTQRLFFYAEIIYSWIRNSPPRDYAKSLELMSFYYRVAKALEKTISCERIGMSVIGLEVPHVHVHLLPINKMADMQFEEKEKMTNEEFTILAEEISRNFI